MDFRTEWSSWLLVILMIIITAFISPYVYPSNGEFLDILLYFARIIGFPLLMITLASIPVVIVCWIVKVIPDIDYSIRTAFVIVLLMGLGVYLGW